MDKELYEKMLKIIKLNKCKKHLLNDMAILELENKDNSDDYISLINLYKRVSSDLDKVIPELDTKEKLIITRVISRLNPVLYQPITLNDSLTNTDDQILIFKKTFIDLGSPLMVLYNDKEEMLKNQLIYAYSTLGIDITISEEEKIDSELVNYYMTSDFTNVLYSEVSNICNFGGFTKKFKRELLKLKYNLIYLAPNLEKRALKTAFSIPDVPSLTDCDAIIDTGINYKKYLSELDGIMIDLLDHSINACLHESDMNVTPIDLINLLFIKTYAALISDTELLDCITIETTNANSDNYFMAVELIKESLNHSKQEAENNAKLRKNRRI